MQKLIINSKTHIKIAKTYNKISKTPNYWDFYTPYKHMVYFSSISFTQTHFNPRSGLQKLSSELQKLKSEL